MDWSESVIDLCPSSPQEPSLDPKAILELPLERLAQKLQNDELSLESVLCSYLEEVAVGSGGGGGGSHPLSSSQEVGDGYNIVALWLTWEGAHATVTRHFYSALGQDGG